MSSFKDKYIDFKAQIKYFPKTIKLIWNASRFLIFAWASLLIFLGTLPALQIYLIKPLVDTLSNIEKENIDLIINDLYLPIIVLALTLLLTPILTSLLSYVRNIQAQKVQNSIRKKIQKKAVSLDMKHFEDSEYYNKLHRAHIDAISKPIALLENIGTFFQNILTFLAILIILLPIAWWFPLVLIVSIIPSLIISLKFILKLHNHRIKTTKDERKLNYLDFLMTNNESAAEVRTFNLEHYFKKIYWKLKHSIQSEYFSILKSQLKLETISSLFSFFVVIIVMLFVVNQTLNGNISIGSLVMYYFAFTQGQKVLKTLFSNISELYKNIMFIENLFEFLSIENLKIKYDKKLKKNVPCKIEISNISFKYPKANKYAIENLSMNLEPNQITAIVGTNGSGKSTLIKLLNAFYYSETGSIKINDEDIRDIDPKSIRKNITILFQNFIKYNLKVKENITLADTTKKISKDKLDDISSIVGINEVIKKLPNEYETVLGRWFGGVELSGGEWQKVALARAYLKDSSILILDEPTSAMDSWAEAKWLEKFKILCKDKTALIVTHRFTTAKHADIIHVMKDGKIVESGSHEELIKQNSLYATSWNKQIKEFKEKDE